jgi:nicotinamidase-related amidase
MPSSPPQTVAAEPYAFEFTPGSCALLIIDMQRDFLEPGGFRRDAGQRRVAAPPHHRAQPPAARRLAGRGPAGASTPARATGPISPTCRRPRNPGGKSKTTIGDAGPMGRILVRGEAGHDIIPELYPLPASPSSTSRARARFSPPTSTPSCSTRASPSWSSPA